MSDNATESTTEVPDIYSMSDEDFLNSPIDDMTVPDTEEEIVSEESEEEVHALDDGEQDDAEVISDESADSVDDESSTDEDAGESDEESPGDTDEDPADTESDSASKDKDEDTRDYKTELEEIMAPFKANGKEVQARTPAEARQLMQMGANYSKKMAALKPHLRAIKMLENNGLLDEGKLNHLIDVSRKDKGAIQKLLEDLGVDPLDLDSEENKNYTPNNHSVSDKQLAVDDALTDIRGTSTYEQTTSTIAGWDAVSRQDVVNNPDVIKHINDHMSNGIFDTITTEIERRRMLGQVPTGTPELHLYRQVGDELFGTPSTPESNTQKVKPAIIKPESTPAKKSTSNKKKLAASTGGNRAKKQGNSDTINPLLMSDEDFEKSVDFTHFH